ncbi:MAG: hypothetical protein WKG06_41495 [Segetibacter sp.]
MNKAANGKISLKELFLQNSGISDKAESYIKDPSPEQMDTDDKH